MIKSEGQYIYIGKVIIKKRNAVLGLLGVLAVVVIAVCVFSNFCGLFLDSREVIAIKEGKMRILGGEVVEVDLDNGKFILDTDVLGQSKKYTIYVDSGTRFSVMVPFSNTPSPKIVNGFPVFEEGESYAPAKPEEGPASFSEMKQGMLAEVTFEDRIDVDGGGKLKAQSVLIIKK